MDVLYLLSTSRGYEVFFFFNDTATTEIYTLSLHDALPIWRGHGVHRPRPLRHGPPAAGADRRPRVPRLHHISSRVRAAGDRKSTRLNSSHANISYAVFCLKKKKIITTHLLLAAALSLSTRV